MSVCATPLTSNWPFSLIATAYFSPLLSWTSVIALPSTSNLSLSFITASTLSSPLNSSVISPCIPCSNECLRSSTCFLASSTPSVFASVSNVSFLVVFSSFSFFSFLTVSSSFLVLTVTSLSSPVSSSNASSNVFIISSAFSQLADILVSHSSVVNISKKSSTLSAWLNTSCIPSILNIAVAVLPSTLPSKSSTISKFSTPITSL